MTETQAAHAPIRLSLEPKRLGGWTARSNLSDATADGWCPEMAVGNLMQELAQAGTITVEVIDPNSSFVQANWSAALTQEKD